jgi:hypothetical protein
MQGEPEHYCAQQARESGEPLIGTATQAAVWLLLEYRQAWRKKAVQDNELPQAVQSHLDAQLEAIPGSRLLFIKKQAPEHEDLRFFVVRTDEAEPVQVEFRLAGYEDLLALDVTAVAGANNPFSDQVRQEPLFLVCTNSKRDRCCAKFGNPLFRVLQNYQPEVSWQSTHIGGHRYAPNVLFLPHSVNYGWLSPEKISLAVDAHLNGQIYDLNYYRGRTYYDPPVQAADYFLRRELDLLDLAGVRLYSAECFDEITWTVLFDLPATGERHEITQQSRMTEEPVPVSCSSPASKPVPHYRLLAHRRI